MKKLYVIDGPIKGESFTLHDGITTIGRSSDNDICISDRAVSRHHAKFVKKDGRIFIVDLKSSQGVLVDGEKIEPGLEVELERDSILAMGNTVLSFLKESSGKRMANLHRTGVKRKVFDTSESLLAKDRPRSYVRSLELLLKVSNILAQSLSIDELLGEVIDQIFNLLKRIDRGAILLLNKEIGTLQEVVSKTRMEDKDGIFSKINYSTTVVNRTVKEGKPVMISDTSRADKADLSDSMKQMNISSVMCVPLTYKGDVKGIIYVDSLGSPGGFRKDDLQVLAALSNTAAIAIENARLYEEVRQELAERKRAEEALKESSEKIRLFAYSVSHDLKSPAVSIFGLTRLLSKHYRDIVDEKGRNYCDQILKASEQIAALVEQINVFISSKENPLKIEPVNMKEVLQMVREEYSAQINIRRIRWLEPESTPEIKVDRLSMLRIIRNLIDNALKYGGDDLSEIRIGHKESDKFHIVSVSDDGVGVKREESEKIFELFQRYETSIGVQGAGLGLAIVKEITEHHGGRVWAEPGPKKGMTFYVSISKYL